MSTDLKMALGTTMCALCFIVIYASIAVMN